MQGGLFESGFWAPLEDSHDSLCTYAVKLGINKISSENLHTYPLKMYKFYDAE